MVLDDLPQQLHNGDFPHYDQPQYDREQDDDDLLQQVVDQPQYEREDDAVVQFL